MEKNIFFLEFYPFKKRLCELQESDVGSLSITSLNKWMVTFFTDSFGDKELLK